MMRIVDVQPFDLEIPYPVDYEPAWQPGVRKRYRTFTLVKIITGDGLAGFAGTDGHHANNIARNVKPFLVGEDPLLTERHQRVLRSAGGMWFLDQALCDIVGKAAGMPLYKLWGAAHHRVRAYASTATLGTGKDRVALARRYCDDGFTAVKLRFHRDRLEDDLDALDAVRDAEPALQLMVDANQATTLPSASPSSTWDFWRARQAAEELARRGVLWLEEPLPRYAFEDLRRLRELAALPIAGGEGNRGLHEFRWLLEQRVYDIIQPDCSLSEGASQLRKIAAAAEMFGVRMVPHHGLSGLGLAATLHLACTLPGEQWLEVMYEPPTRTLEAYQRLGGILNDTIFIDQEGWVKPPEAPGLGVTVDEELISQYEVRA